MSSASRFVDIDLQYIHQYIESKRFDIKYIESEHNIADMFTKAIDVKRLKELKKVLFHGPRNRGVLWNDKLLQEKCNGN